MALAGPQFTPAPQCSSPCFWLLLLLLAGDSPCFRCLYCCGCGLIVDFYTRFVFFLNFGLMSWCLGMRCSETIKCIFKVPLVFTSYIGALSSLHTNCCFFFYALLNFLFSFTTPSPFRTCSVSSLWGSLKTQPQCRCILVFLFSILKVYRH